MSAVENHYDHRARHFGKKRRRDRFEDPAINVRLYCNWIKAVLIQTYSQNRAVLDAAFGRGGDLQKYEHANVCLLLGYDISQDSLNEASRRSSGRLSLQLLQVDFTKTCQQELAATPPVDVINCFFAAHYACKNEDSIIAFLQNTMGRSKPNNDATMIMICPNADRVRAWQLNDDAHPYCQIRINDDNASYHFTMSEAVQDCIEYLVNVKQLQRLAQDLHGFDLVQHTDLLSFGRLQQQQSIYSQLYQRMRVSNRLDTNTTRVIELFDVLVWSRPLTTQTVASLQAIPASSSPSTTAVVPPL
jgi:mRNA (guanine-N7-)-methyltransferase